MAEEQPFNKSEPSGARRPIVSLAIATVVLLGIGLSVGVGIGQQIAPRPTPAPDVVMPQNWTVTLRNPDIEITNWPYVPPDSDGDGVPDGVDDIPLSPFWSKRTVIAQNVVLSPTGTSTFDVPLQPSIVRDVMITLDAPGRVAFGYAAPGCNASSPQVLVGPVEITVAGYVVPYRLDGVCGATPARFYLVLLTVPETVRFLAIEVLS